MEQEITTSEVKTRSVRGVAILTGRTFILQIISLVAQLLLFAYLGTYEFGVFAIVSAIVNFLVYFSDIGLAAALIQKKEHPSEVDLKTTFTLQQILVLLLISIVFVLTPFFSNKYGLDSSGKVLLYSLAISFFMSSLKSIPSVLLERKLEFVKLVFPQILEQVVYNVVLVVMAMNGYGLHSFSAAVLLRGIVGLVALYIIQPWKVGFAFSLKTLKDLFKFGIPYQVNTFLSVIKDDGLTIVLGGIIGPTGLGILSFAQKITRLPLTFFMDTVTKVTFPAFSRLQDSKVELERTVTRSIFFISLFVFPSLMGIVVLSPILISVVPKYQHWQPALIPIFLLAINFALASTTTQLTNLLNAIGKIKITFYLMVMWTVLTWLIVPFLSIRYGVNGTAFAYTLVGMSSIVAIYIAKKHVSFSLSDSVLKPLLGTFIMGLFLVVTKTFLDVSLRSMIILTLVGVVSYGSSMIAIVGLSLIEDAKKGTKFIFNK